MFFFKFFDRLKTERPKFRHRVVAIPGDCTITGLGLTITDRQKLLSDVNIVFHAAASVRFDENLKYAYNINVSGTADVVELCRQMKNLKVRNCQEFFISTFSFRFSQ